LGLAVQNNRAIQKLAIHGGEPNVFFNPMELTTGISKKVNAGFCKLQNKGELNSLLPFRIALLCGLPKTAGQIPMVEIQ